MKCNAQKLQVQNTLTQDTWETQILVSNIISMDWSGNNIVVMEDDWHAM